MARWMFSILSPQHLRELKATGGAKEMQRLTKRVETSTSIFRQRLSAWHKFAPRLRGRAENTEKIRITDSQIGRNNEFLAGRRS